MRFNDENGVLKVTNEGLQNIRGMSFLMRKQELNLLKIINDIKVVAVWIKIFSIPLEFQTPKCLNCIASALGKPFYIDTIKNEGIHLEYA